MKKDIVIVEAYKDLVISFTSDAWVNATEAALRFGKNVKEWFKLESTEDYVKALWKMSNENSLPNGGNSTHLEYTEIIKHFTRKKRGGYGGTYIHPNLAVPFARWLSPEFAIWCDFHIKEILLNQHPRQDWFKERQNAAASFQAMCFALKFKAEREGKELENYHYSNEALLINEVLVGKRDSVEWDNIHDKELLKLRNKLMNINSALISAGMGHRERRDFLFDWIKINGTSRISCKASQ